MMVPFDTSDPFVIVYGTLIGPLGPLAITIAIDTGATTTMIGRKTLINAGYAPDCCSTEIINTAGGLATANVVLIERIEALDLNREHLLVRAIDIADDVNVHAFLGLDFLRGRRLLIDFSAGEIDLGE